MTSLTIPAETTVCRARLSGKHGLTNTQTAALLEKIDGRLITIAGAAS